MENLPLDVIGRAVSLGRTAPEEFPNISKIGDLSGKFSDRPGRL
jgi:hypothetical protein